MTAEEMFDKLGYKRAINTDSHIRYVKDDDNVFYFYLRDKQYCKTGYYDPLCDDVTMEELLAIIKQCEEL